MTVIRPRLNIPQARFLAMENKFKAYVAGYGCVREGTKILTSQGFVPIADLQFGDEVVSYNEKNQQFQISPTSGGFPKGKATLYRVVTTHGEFVASGHHRVRVAQNSYQSVEDLSSGRGLSTSFGIPLQTKPALGRIWSTGDDLYYWQTVLNCLDGYASEGHQYGQQPLPSLSSGRSFAPSQGDARRFGPRSFSQNCAPQDGRLETLREHIRQGLHDGRARKNRWPDLLALPAGVLEGRAFLLCLERIFETLRLCQQSPLSILNHLQGRLSVGQLLGFLKSVVSGLMQSPSAYALSAGHFCELWPAHGSCFSRQWQLFLERCAFHRTIQQSSGSILDSVLASFVPSHVKCHSLPESSIIRVEKLWVNEWFWDIHVAGNNNYITEDGTVHHNSGKTWSGCASIGKHLYEFPRVNAGYFAPTYPQIRDIFYPTVEEALFDWGLTTKVRVGNHEVDVYRGRTFMGTILCRSMEDPGTIVGFKIGKALVDEIDVMPKDKASGVWRKILARMRYNLAGLPNGIDVTTTPEGFRFVYEQFVKLPRSNQALRDLYGIVQASTYDNASNLPDDYIPSLLQSYPPQLIDAYINGKFVNLQTGTVYIAYDRAKNGCADTLQDGEAIFVGMDFNVGKMAAIIHVKRDGLPRAVDEIVGAYDTPDMIRRIKERFWRYDGKTYQPSRQIRVYPDASGGSRKSQNASETDIALLKQAGFIVSAPAANPPVKDRVNSMNAMFLNAKGARRYLVNASTCPTYADALEQQAWSANGEPDKTTGHDHPVDAAGYLIHQDYPLIKRVFSTQQQTGW